MKKMLFGIVAVGLLSSCNQIQGWFGSNSKSDSLQLKTENQYRAKLARDESITKENAYSDLFLDSITVENFIRQKNYAGDKADLIREFYWVRNNQFAWFTSNGLTEQARGLWSLYASEKEQHKDDPARAIKERMDSLIQNDSSIAFLTGDTSLAQTELTLTAQLVQLADESKTVINKENFYWLVPRKKMDAMQLADSLLNKQSDSSAWKNNQQYIALKKSLQLFYNSAKNGGWQMIPSGNGLNKGTKSPTIVLLKKRLAATGDYPVGDTSNVFTDSLVTAIKNVQQQFGFMPTGVVDDSLIQELNVPAQERVQQILVNMNRALWLPPQNDSTWILVNIPSLQLEVYRDTAKVMEMPVIVGKEGTGTMVFTGSINQIVFNPYWHIPASIVKNEIKPEMDKDPNYLKKKHMEIVKQDDSLPQIR